MVVSITQESRCHWFNRPVDSKCYWSSSQQIHAHWMSGTVLRTIWTHLILTTVLWHRHYYHPHFNKKMKAPYISSRARAWNHVVTYTHGDGRRDNPHGDSQNLTDRLEIHVKNTWVSIHICTHVHCMRTHNSACDWPVCVPLKEVLCPLHTSQLHPQVCAGGSWQVRSPPELTDTTSQY